MAINENLIGMKLDGFTIAVAHEVYNTGEDGRPAKTIAFLFDKTIAVAWAQSQGEPYHCKTKEVMIITDGNERHFLFGGDQITLMTDENATWDVRQKALDKLSTEERTVLGL